MSLRYRVVLTGEVLAGHDPEQVRAAAARAFRLDAGQLDRLWGKRAVIRRDASEEEAVRFVARVRGLGLGAECEALAPAAAAPSGGLVEPLVSKPGGAPGGDELFSLTAPVAARAQPDEPSGLALVPESITCPECGEVQPKRTLCRKCGLDMPRYAAAKAEADRTAREEQVFEREVAATERGTRGALRTGDSQVDARLLGLGFSGRLGRLGHLAGSILSWLLLVLTAVVALKTGGKTLLGIGGLLSFIYGLRVMVLRLHDLGRSGWLLLLMIVPLVNLVLLIVLYFVSGDEGDNDYGPQPIASHGGAALASVVAMIIVSSTLGGTAVRSPEEAKKLAALMGVERHGQAEEAEEEDEEKDATYVPAAHYSGENLVVLYSIENCQACDSMRRWLSTQDFRYVEHHVDADPASAQALGEKLQAAGHQGRVRLPVVEVNGVLLTDSPTPRDLHRHLRLAKDV